MYHWIRGLVDESVSLYTFRPHGSKNINDLHFSSPLDLSIISPEIVCHDQEPLDFVAHQNVNILQLWLDARKDRSIIQGQKKIMEGITPVYQHLNFYAMLRARKFQTIFDRYILLHSEKNSRDVELFSATAETVYYWSHAIIARDWFRFAEHDPRLEQNNPVQTLFLVYCRAWTGTREYRLKFLDVLIDHGLLDRCQTSLLHQDGDTKLDSYCCNNTALQPQDIRKLFNVSENQYSADASADYYAEDFVSTAISIVLETVTDNTKIHLTEKTIRPIACGHPFMLLAGPGSLDYLRSYGFKTFSPWIDESYDFETDTVSKINMVIKEMQRISKLNPEQLSELLKNLKEITQHNKDYFFSKIFFERVQNELVTNLNTAVCQVKHTRGQYYLSKFEPLITTYKKSEEPSSLRDIEVEKILRQLRKNPNISIKKITSRFPPEFFYH